MTYGTNSKLWLITVVVVVVRHQAQAAEPGERVQDEHGGEAAPLQRPVGQGQEGRRGDRRQQQKDHQTHGLASFTFFRSKVISGTGI